MLLGFHKRFVPAIENGTKIQTMRNLPKRIPKIGEILHMYTGPYNDQRRLITREHTLKTIQTIKVYFVYVQKENKKENYHYPRIYIDSRELTIKEREEFFVNDGFKNEQDFLSYWKLKKRDCCFLGKLFHWTDYKY